MFTEVMWEVYPAFIDAGYTPSLFWELGFDEVLDMLEGYRRRQKEEELRFENSKKMDAILNSVLARQIQERIAMVLVPENTVTITPLHDFFPKWFEKSKEEEEKEEQFQLELHKARMENYMFWNNRKLKNKGGE